MKPLGNWSNHIELKNRNSIDFYSLSDLIFHTEQANSVEIPLKRTRYKADTSIRRTVTLGTD